MTACIVLGLTSSLVSDTFATVQHATSLQLIDDAWLASTCQNVDRFASGPIALGSAVLQLAAVHAGQYSSVISEDFDRVGDIIGFRKGIFSILPNLLLKMEPTTASIGLTCGDRFFANLATLEKGKIEDASPPRFAWEDKQSFCSEANDGSSLATLHEPWTGRPHQSPPDRLLYLSLEKPPFQESIKVGFVGRIDGSVVGQTSIRDVLFILIRSSRQQQTCNHDDSQLLVDNVKASRWVKSRIRKPTGSTAAPAYVSVKEDNCWALLLAGESRCLRGVIVNRCVACAVELIQHEGNPSVLIGYGGG